jgi:non-ribosomal peptide synthetase component F
MIYLLPHAVERTANRDPDHPAIRFGGETLSYGELADRSARLANVLTSEGVRRGDRVGIYMGKRLESAVAIHGIMRAGAAYVPLDPAAPEARIDFIVRDAAIRHLVTDPPRHSTVRRLAVAGSGLECVVGVEASSAPGIRSIGWADVSSAAAAAGAAPAIEQDLAYILYTSGSTGVPKGVMHTHRSALAFAEIAASTFGFGPEDRVSNHAPLHFDLSTLDYFAAAVPGATTVVIPEASSRSSPPASRDCWRTSG